MGQISQYQVVIPGQLITAALWNGMEENIINSGLTPEGVDAAADTDADYQTQTDPYPASVLSRPTNLLGELQRIRFEIAEMKGTTYHYEDSAATLADLQDHDHTTIGDQIPTAGLEDGAVTNVKLGADAVTGAKIADDAVDSEHIVDGAIDTVHIGDSQVTAGKLAADAVTTVKILDANVTEAKLETGVVNKLGQNIGLVAIVTKSSTGDAVNYSGQGRLKGVCVTGSASATFTVVVDGITVWSGAISSGSGVGWDDSGLAADSAATLNSLDIHFRTSLVVNVSLIGSASVKVAYERGA